MAEIHRLSLSSHCSEGTDTPNGKCEQHCITCAVVGTCRAFIVSQLAWVAMWRNGGVSSLPQQSEKVFCRPIGSPPCPRAAMLRFSAARALPFGIGDESDRHLLLPKMGQNPSRGPPLPPPPPSDWKGTQALPDFPSSPSERRLAFLTHACGMLQSNVALVPAVLAVTTVPPLCSPHHPAYDYNCRQRRPCLSPASLCARD